MRSLSPALVLLLSACSVLPGLDRPEVTLVPQYALLRVTGNTSMQSDDGSGGVQTNPAIGDQELGAGDRDEEWGGTVRLGDGFSGLDLGFLKIDQKASRTGTPSSPWGALAQGAEVQTKLFMDEFRLRYIAQVLEHETAGGAQLTAGAGGMLTHRELKLRVGEVDPGGGPPLSTQNLDIKDDILPYAALRARVSYETLGLQIDYAFNPDLSFGGDFDGVMHDVEIVGTYTFEDQDLTVYAGYRRADLKARGRQDGFGFTTDMMLDGYIFGAHFTF